MFTAPVTHEQNENGHYTIAVGSSREVHVWLPCLRFQSMEGVFTAVHETGESHDQCALEVLSDMKRAL